MAELLKLEKDVPAVIALAFAQGKIVESTIPGAANQVLFTLADGRRTFLPLIAADRIREAGVQANVPFEITKLGPARFLVRNIGVSRDYTPELEASLAQRNAGRAAASPESTAQPVHWEKRTAGAPDVETSNALAASLRTYSNDSATAAPPQAPNAKTNAATRPAVSN